MTEYAYDSAGRLSSLKPPGRGATTYGYNAAGETTSVTDAAGNVTQFQYDYAGRKTATIAADLSKQTAGYDAAGRLIVKRQVSPAGAVLAATSVTYDAAGHALTSTDARGNTTSFTYGATGSVTQVIEPVSATESITTSFGYDIAGMPTRFTDGRGNRFLTTYNSWGKPEAEIEPDGAAFTIAYDAAGRPVTRNAPGGVTVTNAYNSMGQLISQTGTGAEAPTAGRAFDYDLGGRMTSFAEGGSTSSLGYNDRGLLTSVTGAAGASSFGWTGDGLMASRQDASGTTSYGYDNAARLSTVSDASTGQQASFEYDTLSRVKSITYGGSGNKRSYTYDGLHRLETDSLAQPNGATIGSITYGYDLNGNETSKTTVGFAGAGSNTYTYDNASRLVSHHDGTNTTTYAYDKSGNRTQVGSRVFTYNTRNQLTSDGSATYTYTPRGTLSGTTVGTVTTPSTFDAYGQQITQDTRSYAYDGLGRVLTAGAASFAYSGTGNHVASDGTATYSRDPAGDLFGVKTGASGVFAWTDLHDDVVAQFTSTGTTLTGSRTYNPFGTLLATAGIIGNLGYQSGWTDPSTARVNMHTRWYNPDTAQFASRDTATVSPIPNSIRANRYAYGDGNPLTVTDPTGHWGLWNKVTSAVSSAVNKVSSFVSNTVSTVSNAVSSAYNWAREKVSEVKNWAVQKVQNVVQNTKKKLNKVKQAVVKVYNASPIKQIVDTATQVVNNVVDTVVQKTTQLIEEGKKVIVDAYKAAETWVKEHKAEIAGFVVGAVVGVACGVAIGWTGVGAVACGALAGAAGAWVTGAMQGKSGWDLVGDVAAGALFGGVTGGLGSMFGAALSKEAGALWNGLGGKTALGSAWNALKGEGANIANGFRGVANTVTGGARNAWNSATTSLREAGEGITSRLRNAFSREACHSFDPKTPVVLASGQSIAIDKLKVGDKVLATDPQTGRTEAKPVTALHVNLDTDLTDLTVRDHKTGRTTVLKTTQHHPFWDATRKEWVDAAQLRPGDSTLVDAKGNTSTVTSVQNHIGAATMRDLTVDDIHTYYVLAGETAVLVHNNNGLGACRTGGGRPDGQIVFSGHGALEPGAGLTRIPKGTSLKMYSKHGETILDSEGNAIEIGDDIMHVQEYKGGQYVQDYTLYPGDGSNGLPKLNIMGNPRVATKPTRLSALLEPNKGTCHWAACREVID